MTGGNPLFERTSGAAAPVGARHPVRRDPAVGDRHAVHVRVARVLLDAADPDSAGTRIQRRTRRARPRAWRSSARRPRPPSGPAPNPIGQTIRIERPEGRPVSELPGYSEVTVVGVVPDVVSGMMFDGRDAGHIYLPTHPARSARDRAADAAAVRSRSRSVGAAGDLPEGRAGSAGVRGHPAQRDARRADVSDSRRRRGSGPILGAIALVLSVSGLYGVLSYTLTQRTREIGIRMALGATAAAVVRLVMGQSARLAGIGAAIGLVVAFSVLKVLSSAITLSRSFGAGRRGIRRRRRAGRGRDRACRVSPGAPGDPRRSRRHPSRRRLSRSEQRGSGIMALHTHVQAGGPFPVVVGGAGRANLPEPAGPADPRGRAAAARRRSARLVQAERDADRTRSGRRSRAASRSSSSTRSICAAARRVWVDRTLGSAVVAATLRYDTLTRQYHVARVGRRPHGVGRRDRAGRRGLALADAGFRAAVALPRRRPRAQRRVLRARARQRVAAQRVVHLAVGGG